MAVTVERIRGVLSTDFGPLLRVVDVDTLDAEALSVFLDGPISEAVLTNGGTLADAPNVSDDDVLTVTSPWRRFIQFARLYTLERIWGNWPHVDEKAGEESQMLNQLAVRLQKRMEEIKEGLMEPESIENAGIVEGPPTVGIIKAGSYLPNDLFGSNPDITGWPYA